MHVLVVLELIVELVELVGGIFGSESLFEFFDFRFDRFQVSANRLQFFHAQVQQGAPPEVRHAQMGLGHVPYRVQIVFGYILAGENFIWVLARPLQGKGNLLPPPAGPGRAPVGRPSIALDFHIGDSVIDKKLLSPRFDCNHWGCIGGRPEFVLGLEPLDLDFLEEGSAGKTSHHWATSG